MPGASKRKTCDGSGGERSGQLSNSELWSFLGNQRFELASGDAADVTLRVGEDEETAVNIRFARFLLAAQSPVFHGMLYGSMLEADKAAAVRVCFPLPAVQQMLHFVCSAELALDVSTAVDLHRLADFYQMQQLKIATADFMITNLNAETAVHFLAVAQCHRLVEFESKCLGYILKNASDALMGDRVAQLSEVCLLSLVQSEELCMQELEVFRAVVRWGKANTEQHASKELLRKTVSKLMEHVRLPLLSGEVLVQEVEPSGLVSDLLLRQALAAKFKKDLPDDFRFRCRSKACQLEAESKILDQPMKVALGQMMPIGGAITCRLVHDSTRGTSAAAFDAAVHGVGPTLTVIRDQNTEFVFGAYVHDTYSNGVKGWKKASEHTFLFLLGNGLQEPVKLVSSTGNANWCSGCGCTLGDSRNIFSAFFENNHANTGCAFATFAPGYSGICSKALLSGNEDGRFTPGLMEVFAVSGTS
ncbi:unnamed protein product [Polarella glacialis]|uniref:BTB domain-containing protein n=1 Tax=Polarella glacialis TaxID=89957 RepID=A0A813F8V3_POLGL|nr:unnamed protein product [Polarella glacialis]